MKAEDWPLYHYRAGVVRVVDGDTAVLMLDLGDRTHRERSVRLLGANAPEVRGPEKADGLAARDFLEELLPPGRTVYVRTEKDATSFERLLGRVYVADVAGELLDVSEALIRAGHATPA